MTSADQQTVRAIAQLEQDQFFDVLCRAFQLNPELAGPIYDQDPFFDLTHKRSLFNGGQIASVLTVIPSSLRLHSQVQLPLAGIAGVGTLPELTRLRLGALRA